jgi:hypothetical protein
MTTKCASFVRGRVLRATRLDGCGRPVIGDDSVVVSKGWTSVAYTANTDEGEEINVTNAAGETCVREPAKPKFLGYTVEITFCNVDPDVFALLTGQRTIVDDIGDVIGFTMDTAVSASDVNFSLEVWAGSPSGNACDNPGAAGGTYGYFLLPFLQGGVVGDFTIENAEVTFTVSGAATLDGNAWGRGLYPAVLDSGGTPALLVDPLTKTDHLLAIITGMAPPAAHCGARPYLDPEDAALTSVTATPVLLEVTFAPVPSGSDPWWIDYGDGSWEYIEDGTSAVHDYPSAGTYSYVAYRGSSSFSGTVTVTAA